MAGNQLNEERSEFLSRLLDRRVDWRDDLKLTSGQKARYFAWCDQNGVEYLLGNDADKESLAIRDADVNTNINLTAAQVGNINGGAITAIGTDIQQISELFPQDLNSPKTDKSLTSIFSLQELSYAESSDDIRQTLTGMFAAKEAMIKAYPEYMNRNLSDIEILHQSNGAPTHDGFQLSISHSGDYALAVAMFINSSTTLSDTQESVGSTEMSKMDVNRISQSKKQSESKLHRSWLLAKSLILILGIIGGLWVLFDKLSLLVS